MVIDGRETGYSHHIVISNNVVHECGGGGISAIHADYIIVEDNIVYNNSWYSIFGTSGISFYQFRNHNESKTYRNIIRRNKCYDNKSMVPWYRSCKLEDGNGIIIDDFMNKQNGSDNGLYRGKTLIENNVCWNNGGTGIHTFQSSNVDILNNTSYCNSRTKKLNAGEILAGNSENIRIIRFALK
ncbi:MAG: right-handed parallel beta-helix repeat-containing protein [Flavobacterium sp.]|nr:MAG: right-handed parallel beta-helix repeat-containing protein [Flavobacterium sp.]